MAVASTIALDADAAKAPSHVRADPFVLAHVRELSAAPSRALSNSSSSSSSLAPTSHTTSAQLVRWHPISRQTAQAHGIRPSDDHLVAIWSAHQRSGPGTDAPSPRISTPLIHLDECRLEITTFPGLPNGGMIERVALPRSAVEELLRSLTLPDGAAAEPHFDDADDWVYSRCLLADFSGLAEDEAALLSAEGRLCCQASVVLMRDSESHRAGYDIVFVVHRVFARRDPGVGRCACV